MMTMLEEIMPRCEIYSIDESFGERITDYEQMR